jgi:hypothetical protein
MVFTNTLTASSTYRRAAEAQRAAGRALRHVKWKLWRQETLNFQVTHRIRELTGGT